MDSVAAAREASLRTGSGGFAAPGPEQYTLYPAVIKSCQGLRKWHCEPWFESIALEAKPEEGEVEGRAGLAAKPPGHSKHLQAEASWDQRARDQHPSCPLRSCSLSQAPAESSITVIMSSLEESPTVRTGSEGREGAELQGSSGGEVLVEILPGPLVCGRGLVERPCEASQDLSD